MKTIQNESELEIDVPEVIITTTIKDKETNIINNWSCDVCGGDDETGCLMSDPQGCPYGRGI